MKLKFNLPTNSRYWNVDRMMKLLLLAFLPLTVTSLMYGQRNEVQPGSENDDLKYYTPAFDSTEWNGDGNVRKLEFAVNQRVKNNKISLVYPNPAKNELYLKYNVNTDKSTVEVSVYNVLDRDREVSLYKGSHSKGEYFEWYNVQSLNKGVYILQLKVGDETSTERLVIEK